MKKYKIAAWAFLLLGMGACSENEQTASPQDAQENVRVDGITARLYGRDASASTSTRADGDDYVVNKNADPTSPDMPFGREKWLLDVQIYDGNDPYQYGSATMHYVAADYRWETLVSDSIFFPNYLTQQVACQLYDPAFTEIVKDQRDATGEILFAQDVLIQNGDSTVRVVPSHAPVIYVKHAHSMFDFRLMNVDKTRISSISLEVDGDVYYPYDTQQTVPEYLVIVPVGSSEPLIKVVTTDGAQYEQTVEMEGNTEVNMCYCFTLHGLELTLSPITVVDWVTGEALYAQYTAVTAYPTFYGPAGVTCTLFFDNGLSQEITFNDRGEATVKPAGRTIIRLVVNGKENVLSPPVVLTNMIIDLTQEIDAAV
ncbi:MAG: hypothetical protein LUF04_09935 [Bacteroides sp.]|nr:hypothetical protein [Bacteroides sp.]